MKWIEILLAPVSAIVYFSASYVVISATLALTLSFQKVFPRTIGLKHFPAKLLMQLGEGKSLQYLMN